MKKILQNMLVAVAMLTSVAAFAQLPDGSVAPDFTGTDINGNTFTLSEALAAGKTVIMDVSATWCGPCWNYHNTHALADVYECLGPDAADKVVVLFIEGDGQTTNADLNGTGGNTQGDWVTGTPYPIIDDASIADLYQIAYFPTIYKICPDGIVTEVGQQSGTALFTESLSGCNNEIDGGFPCFGGFAGSQVACGEATVAIDLMNVGGMTISSASFDVYYNGAFSFSYDYTGTIAGGATSNGVTIGTVPGPGDVEIMITSVNGETINNQLETTIYAAEAGTTHIRFDIKTDCWGEELSWRLIDGSGTVVEQAGTNTYADVTVFQENYYVPVGCYTLEINDAYGDGLQGSLYTACGQDGYFIATTVNDGGAQASTIVNYNGSYTYTELIGGADASTVVGVEESELINSFVAYPNPFNTFTNLSFNVAEASDVTIEVVNLLGARVMNMDLGTVVAGEHRQVLDFSELSSGLYLINITANGQMATMRVTLNN
jgi:thiol-disulfide isomerase/thioredoxin